MQLVPPALLLFGPFLVTDASADIQAAGCGKTLAPLCRQFHAQKRLPDKKILFVGGECLQGTACSPVLFDPVKQTIQPTAPFPTQAEFSQCIGYRVDDNTFAFTNRTHSLDPNKFMYDNSKDTVAFWDAAKNQWLTGVHEQSRMAQASAPFVLRKKDKGELGFFTGSFKSSSCQYSDDFDNKVPCPTIVDISADAYLIDKGKIGNKVEYGTLRRQRIQFDTTTFADGRLFVVGGFEIPTSEKDATANERNLAVARTAEYYLPAKKQWFETPPLPKPIEQARSFGLSEDETLVVDLESGSGVIWSFSKGAWRDGFSAESAISRAIMHTQGRLVATVEGSKETEKLLLWNPVKKTRELLDSPLPFFQGTGLIELDDQRVLETQPSGILLWDLKKKTAIRLKR